MLRGRSVRIRGHNGRLKKAPTCVYRWNYHTIYNSRAPGGVFRFWKMVRLFL